jgi:membrane protease YdiL (CAAX protease family)
MSAAIGHPPRIVSGVTGSAQRQDAPLWNHWDMVKAIGVVVVATLVAAVAAAAIVAPFVESGQDLEDNATAYTIVLIPTMIAEEILLLAAALWFGPRKYRLSLATLGLRKPERDVWWLAAAMAGACLALVYGYDAALSLVGVSAAAMPDQVFDNPGPFIVVAVGAVLMAPLMEEVFLRGFIFGGLRAQRGWLVAAVVSSLLFAVAHLDPVGVPAYAGIGFLFAWAYHYTGSLKSSIIAHATVNTVTVGVGLATSGVL